MHLPNLELFSKVFRNNESCIAVTESKFFHQEQKTSLLSIIISEAFYKRKLFGHAIFIHKNKQQTFSLNHSTKNYSSIHKENYLDSDL